MAHTDTESQCIARAEQLIGQAEQHAAEQKYDRVTASATLALAYLALAQTRPPTR